MRPKVWWRDTMRPKVWWRDTMRPKVWWRDTMRPKVWWREADVFQEVQDHVLREEESTNAEVPKYTGNIEQERE